MARPDDMEDILLAGAAKAREIAVPLLQTLREAVGLRSARHRLKAADEPVAAAVPKGKPPRFASFRDADGSFRFRLFGADGEELLLSKAFVDPKAAGTLRQTLATLGGAHAVIESQGDHVVLLIDGDAVAQGQPYPDDVVRAGAVLRLRTALDVLAAVTADEAAAKAANRSAG
jgi:tryptophanyl-tRNA synthetase